MDQEIKREIILLNREIRIHVLMTSNGINVLLEGGDLGHIGSVSIFYQGKVQTVTIPGHKEAVISEEWAMILGSRFQVPVVVEAGIHYDQISKEEIIKVLFTMNEELKNTEKILETCIKKNKS